MQRSILALLITLLAALALAGPASAATQPPSMAHGTYTSCKWTPTPSYPGCDASLAELRSMGFTRVIADTGPIRGTLGLYERVARGNGIQVVWQVPYVKSRADMRSIVRTVRDFPNTRGYYIADEPGQFDGRADARQAVGVWATEIKTSLAANRPGRNVTYTASAACTREEVQKWTAQFASLRNLDYAMTDCYPYNKVGQRARTQEFTAAARDAVNGGPLGLVVQAFDWSLYPAANPGGLSGWPPSNVLRVYRDCAAARRASELYWYSQTDWRRSNPSYASTVATAAASGVGPCVRSRDTTPETVR